MVPTLGLFAKVGVGRNARNRPKKRHIPRIEKRPTLGTDQRLNVIKTVTADEMVPGVGGSSIHHFSDSKIKDDDDEYHLYIKLNIPL